MAFFFGKKETTPPPPAPPNSNQLTNTRIIRTLKTDLIELDAQEKGGAAQKNDKANFVTLSQPSFPEPREVNTPTTPPPPAPKQTVEKEKILVNPFTETAIQNPETKQPQSPPEKKFAVIKPIHTYTSDIAENIQKQHATIADIVQAEEAKRRNEPVVTKRSGLRIAVSLLLVILGIGLIGGAGYLVYSFVIPKKTTPIAVSNPVRTELFKIDSSENALFIPEKKKIEDSVIAMINKTADGQVRKINFTKTNSATSAEITSQEILTGLEIEQTDLINSITPGIIIGNFKKGNINSPFIVVKAKSSETTYQALIKWEKDLFRDLQNILVADKNAKVLPPFFGSTATGFRYQFEDGAIQSKDIRIARDANNNPVILYGFLDQEYVLITTSGEAFREIFSRFTKARYVQ